MSSERYRPSAVKLGLGIGIMVAGILFTLDNFGVVYMPNLWKFWPLILIGVGLSNVRGRQVEESLGGWFLVVLGVLFQLRTLDVIHFSLWKFLPLILVLIGVRIILGAARHGEPCSPRVDSSSRVSGFVAFGGIDRKIASRDFRGGDLAAFCGGWELDLSQAEIADEEARLDVFAWWGGGEIRVPPTWNVVLKVLPLFGGAEDETVHPIAEPGKPPKQLVVTGTVVMGGVSVKN